MENKTEIKNDTKLAPKITSEKFDAVCNFQTSSIYKKENSKFKRISKTSYQLEKSFEVLRQKKQFNKNKISEAVSIHFQCYLKQIKDSSIMKIKMKMKKIN